MKKEIGDFIEASGLHEYDPTSISKIYRNHPRRLLKRLWQTLIPLFLFLVIVGFEKVIGLFKNEEKAKNRAKEFTDLLVRLGPAFIKAGQALSTRPDVVPRIVLEQLAKLQDELPGFDGDLAMSCIKEDLGTDSLKVFKELDKMPISAASLGQVHRGLLQTGEKVAVKIQRPGLREQITLDLYIVRNIAIWLKKYLQIIKSDLVGLVDELGKRVFEEMDYINEANNAEKFRELHKGNKEIVVPKIFKEVTSRRVLTMEWIDGVKLTNMKAIRNLDIDPNDMIKIGVNCSLKQLLEHGFFHADPHPGNLLALPSGKLCYLDFGMMSEVSKKSRNGLIQAVVHLVNKDFDKLSKDFVQLGFLKHDVDLKPIVPAFEKVFSNALEMGVNRMDFKSVTDDLSGVMYKFPFQLPPYYALIIRSLITLEGIALSVDSDFKILGAAYPYFAKRLMEDPDPELRSSLKEMVFNENSFDWYRLKDLISSATKQAELDLDILLDQIIDFLFSSNGGVLREELVHGIIKRVDLIGWKTVNRINNKLPKMLRSKRISKLIQSDDFLEVKPIRQLIDTVKNLPGFKIELIIKRLPRLFKEKDARNMGVKIAKGVTEKGLVRVIRLAAGVHS